MQGGPTEEGVSGPPGEGAGLGPELVLAGLAILRLADEALRLRSSQEADPGI
jgi:hypothetical protein